MAEDQIKLFHGEVLSLLWSVDCTSKATEQDTLKLFKYATYVAKLNCFLAVITGFVMIPIGKEREYDFALFLFQNYFTSFHYIFDLGYVLSFPVLSYLLVTVANFFAYYTCHAKSQMHLLSDVVSHMTDEFIDYEDATLFYNEEYQEIVRQREIFIVKRHIQLRRLVALFYNCTLIKY